MRHLAMARRMRHFMAVSPTGHFVGVTRFVGVLPRDVTELVELVAPSRTHRTDANDALVDVDCLDGHRVRKVAIDRLIVFELRDLGDVGAHPLAGLGLETDDSGADERGEGFVQREGGPDDGGPARGVDAGGDEVLGYQGVQLLGCLEAAHVRSIPR